MPPPKQMTYKSPLTVRKNISTAVESPCGPADYDRSTTTMMELVSSRIHSFHISTPSPSFQKWETSALHSEHHIEIMLEGDQTDFEDLISIVSEGMLYHAPEICEEGSNGTYFLKDRNGKMIGVFKPQDEEGNSIHNPKRLPDSFRDRGILEGEGAQREIAAYLLDKHNNFAGVPRTTMVKISHPIFGRNIEGIPIEKIGSLQEYIQNDGASWDIGFNVFPIHEVQKIAVLDLRIFNNDRHGGNILLTKNGSSYTLVPIDHGFSLPSTFNCAWFDWLTWPQVQQPLLPEIKEYVQNIDVEKDLEKLGVLHLRPECLNTLKISTMLLKKGCQKGLTLFDIGNILSRAVPEEPSKLEIMIEEAWNRVDSNIQDKQKKMLEELSNIIDQNI